MKAALYVEIDLRYCALEYGATNAAGTCPAVLGVDSEIKCFNTPKTCPVRAAFLDEPVTLRFGLDNGFLPKAIECIPSLLSVSLTPAQVSLGKDLGRRASLAVTLRDHPHSDTGAGFDKYVAERPYDPYRRGTFWGKFRARHPFVQGRRLRVIRGFVPDRFAQSYPMGTPLPAGALIEQDVRHYVAEFFEGPHPESGEAKIVAKDILKLADGDRALAPKPSNGRLAAPIDASAGTLSLSPAGIGEAEYPAEGFGTIGGAEIVAFERDGDTLTIQRARKNTAAQAHDAGDRFQLMLSFEAETPAQIFDRLFREFAGVDADFIPFAQWELECETFLARLYSADIAEPTPVARLAAELIEQASLALWWDDALQQIRLRVLRPVAESAPRFGDSNILVDKGGRTTLRVHEQPESRYSQLYTYFAPRSPIEGVDEQKNYRSARGLVDTEAEADWEVPAIHTVHSRWIPAGGAAAADRINEIQLSRFRTPPRRVSFEVFRLSQPVPELGGAYRLSAWPLQDETGAPADMPIQVTRVKPRGDAYEVEAEEARGGATPEDLTNRRIVIDTHLFNVGVRALHDQFYPPPEEDDDFTLEVTVEAGVVVGSASTDFPALDLGGGEQWPAGVTIRLVNRGRIQGKGGKGGKGRRSASPPPAEAGGPALRLRRPAEIDNAEGQIYGGGGGGGGGGLFFTGTSLDIGGNGGGGAGTDPGAGGDQAKVPPGDAGTADAGGEGKNGVGGGGPGGKGGGPGQAGKFGEGSGRGSPGAAGAAIDGFSFADFVAAPGNLRGPQIN